MSSGDAWSAPYTARISIPEYLERNRAQVVSLEVYRDGALAAPSSGTFTLFDAQGAEVVSAAAVTVSGSIAQYSIPAATLPTTKAVGEGWLSEWALVMPDGITHTFRRSSALVLRALYPVITDLDLLALYTDLNLLRPSGLSSFQGYIDEAWRQVLGRLISKGRFPYLIVDPWALREIHLETTLGLIFRDFASSIGEGRWLALAENHKKEASFAWQALTFQYDEDHDGQPDGGERRKSAHPVVYLSNAPRTRWGGW